MAGLGYFYASRSIIENSFLVRTVFAPRAIADKQVFLFRQRRISLWLRRQIQV